MHHVGPFQVLRALAAHPLVSRQLRAPTMAGHAAFTSGFACFLACPFVGRALLMGGLATLAGNLALLRAVHRSESAVLFSHTDLLPIALTLPASTRCAPGKSPQHLALVRNRSLHLRIARSGHAFECGPPRSQRW